MKKLLSIVFAVCVCFSLAVTLVSCGHTHTFSEDWTKDETHHWHVCTGKACAEISDKAEHVWNDGEITTPATTTEKGVKTFTCTVCAQTKTESVDYIPASVVTADQWSAAFDLGDNFTIVCKQTYSTSGTRLWTDKRAGNLFESILEETSAGGETDVNYNYGEIVGDVFYNYIPSYDTDHTLKGYNKYPSNNSPEDYIAMVLAQYLPDSLRDMSAYTYNVSTRLYECFDATAYGTELDGVFIGFEDGKLICFVYAFTTSTETITISGTISYGNALIALPSADQIL